MRHIVEILLVSAFLAVSANAQQSVRQSGNVTPGHVSVWFAPGVIGDGGVPGGPIFTGSTTQNDFACVGTGAPATIIDCGLSSTGTNAWIGLQSFNGGATAPTRSNADNTTNVATTAYVQNSLTGGIVISCSSMPALTGNVTSSSGSCGTTIANGVVTNAMLANMNSGTFKCSSSGVPAAPSDCTGLPVTGGSPPTVSGTSGGILYFNSATSLVSSGALSSGAIVLGGGVGGSPTSALCTIDTNPQIFCQNAISTYPRVTLQNNTSDTAGPYFLLTKTRSGGNSLNGDTLGIVGAQGFTSSGVENGAQIAFIQAAASSGANLPSKITLQTSNTSGLLNQSATFDNLGHLGISASTTPSASACAGFSTSAGANDFNGTISLTSATTCVMNFANPFTTAPFCVVSPGSAASTHLATATINQLSVTFGTAQTKFTYICTGT